MLRWKMANKQYYSTHIDKNPNSKGFKLFDFLPLFIRLYNQLTLDGYFTESFGFMCVDSGYIPGKVPDPVYDILIRLRKKDIWPIENKAEMFSEEDLFDVIEYLFDNVSKPVSGKYHDWQDCGMHWETFNIEEGKQYYTVKINELLELYDKKYILTDHGGILQKADKGFDKIFEADIPTKDINIKEKIDNAIHRFRKYGSSIEERRLAVRDLADVLEYLKPNLKRLLSTKDESDLFNIANNFGIRHHNDKQHNNYDKSLWFSWMFYYYLATIHLILRKIDNDNSQEI